MRSRFTELAVDCHDPERLAAFWCEVLDFKVIDRNEGKVEIGSWEPTVEEVRARQMSPTLRARLQALAQEYRELSDPSLPDVSLVFALFRPAPCGQAAQTEGEGDAK